MSLGVKNLTVLKWSVIVAVMMTYNVAYGQKLLPRFENDTLYTTSGFNLYAGQTLKFGKGTGNNGWFRYARLTKGGNEKEVLTNNSVVVTSLKHFAISGLGNGYIYVKGKVTYKDGSKGYAEFNLAFDKAIESFAGLPSELVVPDEFRAPKTKGIVSDELSKLYKLYQDSVITRDEFESQKKKLLEQ